MGSVRDVLAVVVIWVVAVVMMPGWVLWWVYFGGALVLGLLCAWCYGCGGLVMRGFVGFVDVVWWVGINLVAGLCCRFVWLC